MSESNPVDVLNRMYKEVVESYRDKSPLGTINQQLDNINDFIVTDIPEADYEVTAKNHEFLRLLIEFPSVWLKIVLTFVFWITLDEITVSETIKNLFQHVDLAQNEALHNKFFSFNRYSTDEAAARAGKLWFNKIIYPIFVNRASFSIERVKGILEKIIKKADSILEDNAGSKALAACEASARGTTLFHYLKLMGCLSGLVAEGTPECAQIREALSNLIESAENVVKL